MPAVVPAPALSWEQFKPAVMASIKFKPCSAEVRALASRQSGRERGGATAPALRPTQPCTPCLRSPPHPHPTAQEFQRGGGQLAFIRKGNQILAPAHERSATQQPAAASKL